MDLLVCDHIEWHAVKGFQVLSHHDPYARSTTRPLSLHTVDQWESTFSLSLPDTRNLFEERVGISSTEVAGEAVLIVSTVEMMGVADMTGVTEGPFPVTRTPFFPMLDKGSSFLDLIFTYMSLLNLVVIFARIGYLKKKKRKKGTKKKNWYWRPCAWRG